MSILKKTKVINNWKHHFPPKAFIPGLTSLMMKLTLSRHPFQQSESKSLFPLHLQSMIKPSHIIFINNSETYQFPKPTNLSDLCYLLPETKLLPQLQFYPLQSLFRCQRKCFNKHQSQHPCLKSFIASKKKLKYLSFYRKFTFIQHVLLIVFSSSDCPMAFSSLYKKGTISFIMTSVKTRENTLSVKFRP